VVLDVVQERQLASVASKQGKRLPDDINYHAINTLSMEAREKLSKVGAGGPIFLITSNNHFSHSAVALRNHP
jgi:hypothetical protein